MALNLNPAAIANAIPYNNTLNAQVLKGCNIQVSYKTAPGMIINMAAGGSANPPLDQTCALWVDNSNSAHDVTIIVPDSGQQIRVAFGAQKLCPLFSSLQYPIFYVMLDDNGLNSLTDVTNIIALNMYVPEFSSEDFTNSLNYGYGEEFELVPAFTQATWFRGRSDKGDWLNVLTDPDFFNFELCTQFYLTYLSVSIIGNVTAGPPIPGMVSIWDGALNIGNLLFQLPFTLTSNLTASNLITLGGMNFKSSGDFGGAQSNPRGGLYMYVTDLFLSPLDITNISSDSVAFMSAGGGVLIS